MRNFIWCACLLLIGLGTVRADSLAPTQPSPEEREIRSKVAAVYTHEIGVKELTGHNDGKRVEEYLAVTGFGKGYSWCAAFVSWTFVEAKVYALKNAWADAWFHPSSRLVYVKGKTSYAKATDVRQADVGGIDPNHDGVIDHVFFIDRWQDDEYVVTVEGNESNMVKRMRRPKINIDKVSRWIGMAEQVRQDGRNRVALLKSPMVSAAA